MPDLPVTLANTLIFGQNLVGCQDPAVDLDVSDDYLLFDNQIEVTYKQETRSLGRDGKVAVTGLQVITICHARLYTLDYRDLLSEAAGHLKVGDARVELSIKELAGITPQTGDRLTAPSGVYQVFAVDFDHTAQMHIVWCRK